jgi:hypothetical protein
MVLLLFMYGEVETMAVPHEAAVNRHKNFHPETHQTWSTCPYQQKVKPKSTCCWRCYRGMTEGRSLPCLDLAWLSCASTPENSVGSRASLPLWFGAGSERPTPAVRSTHTEYAIITACWVDNRLEAHDGVGRDGRGT